MLSAATFASKGSRAIGYRCHAREGLRLAGTSRLLVINHPRLLELRRLVGGGQAAAAGDRGTVQGLSMVARHAGLPFVSPCLGSPQSPMEKLWLRPTPAPWTDERPGSGSSAVVRLGSRY